LILIDIYLANLHSRGSQRLVDQALHKSDRRCRLKRSAEYVTVIPNQSTKLASDHSLSGAMSLEVSIARNGQHRPETVRQPNSTHEVNESWISLQHIKSVLSGVFKLCEK
jgi:hypothetical protein